MTTATKTYTPDSPRTTKASFYSKKKKKNYSKGPKKTPYEKINDKLLGDLESNKIPWQRPWSKVQGLFPKSFNSHKVYRGVNFMNLMEQEFYTPYFVTFLQAKSLGIKVKKGEKSHDVFFFKMYQTKDKKTNEDKTIPILMHHNVFNVSQLEQLPEGIVDDVKETQENFKRLDVKDFIRKINPTIKNASQRAYFSPSDDFINMPKRDKFKSEDHFLCTLFHELTHWTGSHKRLDRLVVGQMGSESYSKEELVAEIGASYLCGIFGIDNDKLIENSQAYIKGWASKLKKDDKLYYTACRDAQKAVEFLLDKAEIDINTL